MAGAYVEAGVSFRLPELERAQVEDLLRIVHPACGDQAPGKGQRAAAHQVDDVDEEELRRFPVAGGATDRVGEFSDLLLLAPRPRDLEQAFVRFDATPLGRGDGARSEVDGA